VGLDAVGGAHLTTQPGPHARPSSLHPRLTVALAPEAARARLLDALEGVVVHAEDLWRAADGLAAERSGDRAATRSRLDAAAARALHDVETARSQGEHLELSRAELLDGATWATQLGPALPGLRGAIDDARAVLEHHSGEQRSARHSLERVLEQRGAAAAAIEEADRELTELVGVGMDETGLRRELEASGQAVRNAQDAHAAAVGRIEDLRGEAASLNAQMAELRAAADTETDDFVDPLLVDRVRQWLASWTEEAALSGLDPQAQALAKAWTDLLADLAEFSGQMAPRPTEADLAAVEARAARAARELERQGPAEPLSPEERAALEAAHDAVLRAEERTDRRIGAAAARKRLDEARAAERALLDQHGFASHLDVVLTGGRASVDSTARLAAERAYLTATTEREALLAALQGSPELEYLQTERARLEAHAIDVLGIDPGPDVVALLRAHPRLPSSVVEGLRDALRDVDVEPVGIGLAEAAQGWLAGQDAAAVERDRRRERSGGLAVQLAAITARQADLTADLAAAEAAEAHAAEQLELSLRSVGTFEAELSVRVGEDAQRLQRFAAAQQLRNQVDALGSTLAKAERDARGALDHITTQVVDAEVAVDKAVATLTEHTRKARRLASELPIDQRPEGDPLDSLPQLAERLQAHAVVLEPEILAAERALAGAAQQLDAAVELAQGTSNGLEGPLEEDVRDGLVEIFKARPGQLIVLAEPFAGLDSDLHHELLELVLERSGTAATVLLTEDADVLSWAIELPAEVGTAVPADALLTVDLTASRTSSMPADPASTPRRVGQR
jgi:hypothetical protein